MTIKGWTVNSQLRTEDRTAYILSLCLPSGREVYTEFTWRLGSLSSGREIYLEAGKFTWRLRRFSSSREVYLEAGEFTWRLGILPSGRNVYLKAEQFTWRLGSLPSGREVLSEGWKVYLEAGKAPLEGNLRWLHVNGLKRGEAARDAFLQNKFRRSK